MFFVIWGRRGRESEVGRGRFYCPECDSEQPYRLVSVSTWFTLYFIPVFVTERHGQYVHCKRCRGKFDEVVLEQRPRSRAQQLIEATHTDLAAGTPLEMARTKLVNRGLDSHAAEELVAAASGHDIARCRPCELHYLAGTRRCSACGNDLATGDKPRRVVGRLVED